MECGLPIIVTRVPLIAYEIEDNNAGIVIGNTQTEFIEAIFKLLLNEEELMVYKRNAMKFAVRFYWETVFEVIFTNKLAIRHI